MLELEFLRSEEPTDKRLKLDPAFSAPPAPEHGVAGPMPPLGPSPPSDTHYGYTPWLNTNYSATQVSSPVLKIALDSPSSKVQH